MVVILKMAAEKQYGGQIINYIISASAMSQMKSNFYLLNLDLVSHQFQVFRETGGLPVKAS